MGEVVIKNEIQSFRHTRISSSQCFVI